MAGPEAAFPLVNAKPVVLGVAPIGDNTEQKTIVVSGMTPLTPQDEDRERALEMEAAAAERAAAQTE